MEASKEYWVKYQIKATKTTLCNHSIASLVFGVNPLFLGGLHIPTIIHIKKNVRQCARSTYILRFARQTGITQS